MAEPLSDDSLEAEAVDRAADRVGEWLAEKLRRRDGSYANLSVLALTRDDVRAIASAAVVGFVVARSEQAARGDLPIDDVVPFA